MNSEESGLRYTQHGNVVTQLSNTLDDTYTLDQKSCATVKSRRTTLAAATLGVFCYVSQIGNHVFIGGHG